ncbi:hypothetical protein, partial [Deferrisoma palaeochoriense]
MDIKSTCVLGNASRMRRTASSVIARSPLFESAQPWVSKTFIGPLPPFNMRRISYVSHNKPGEGTLQSY